MTTETTTLTDRYAANDGVKIHYMAGGSGPLIVFVHGFPDFWHTWHHQLDALVETHSVAAMDTRGYNLSDAPPTEDAYTMPHLVDDIAAVIANEERSSAVVVGHDWGATTAWAFARMRPELTERLIVLSVPHPSALAREMTKSDGPQVRAFGYMRDYREQGSESRLSAEALAASVARDDDQHWPYLEAFERAGVGAMMNYYRSNVPSERDELANATRIEVPVLQFHGLEHPVLLSNGLNNTWDYLANTWTLVTIPGAGHWPHHDRPQLVTHTMVNWLQTPITEPITPAPKDTESGCCVVTTPPKAESGCCA